MFVFWNEIGEQAHADLKKHAAVSCGADDHKTGVVLQLRRLAPCRAVSVDTPHKTGLMSVSFTKPSGVPF